MAEFLLPPFAVTVAMFFALWLVSLPLRNVTYVDAYWGPGFAVIAWVAGSAADWEGWRGLLLASLASIWGLRLGIHLGARALREGHEDKRYAAMRARRGSGFWIQSLYIVFGLQAAIMWTVALPLQLVWLEPAAPFGWLDGTGLALFACGFFFELRADWELARFRRNPANAGKVLDTGLWALSRHPNYFGDACVWWSFGVLGLAGGAPLWVLIGPALMTFLLRKVSGVPLMESGLMESRDGYDAYRARTSAFLPRPPKPGPDAQTEA
jgi:steroid 5-alpha reductase family enzyme